MFLFLTVRSKYSCAKSLGNPFALEFCQDPRAKLHHHWFQASNHAKLRQCAKQVARAKLPSCTACMCRYIQVLKKLTFLTEGPLISLFPFLAESHIPTIIEVYCVFNTLRCVTVCRGYCRGYAVVFINVCTVVPETHAVRGEFPRMETRE